MSAVKRARIPSTKLKDFMSESLKSNDEGIYRIYMHGEVKHIEGVDWVFYVYVYIP